jgi:polar amino acid transport system substrate-binding protein
LFYEAERVTIPTLINSREWRAIVRRLLQFLFVLAFAAAVAAPLEAEPAIPDFWDAKERLAKPDISDLQRLRFLTTVDFPPFNFIDSNGRLSGFHVDLARAICQKLAIVAKCQIQALPWNELEGALRNKDGEAIIAGVAVTQENRTKYAFTRSYLKFPARFVTQKAKALTEPLAGKLKGEQVGAVKGSAHEQMLRDYFPGVKVVAFERQEQMLAELKAGRIAAAFGDGMRLGFWLAGSDSADCCRFSGGPYLAPEYLGAGLAIAVAPDNAKLAAAFDYALHQINADGTFAELYLRYFPVGFY